MKSTDPRARWPWAVVAAVALLLSIPGGPARADGTPYLLVPGDVVRIHDGQAEDPVAALIDIDGQIRLPAIGPVTAAQLTLDQLEDLLEDTLAERGQLLDPAVTATVAEYAPVIVAGDVGLPGRFDYLPGMTVSAALGLSGGSHAAGIGRLELARARAEIAGQLQSLNLEIAAALARQARLAATTALPLDGIEALPGAPPLGLTPGEGVLIPAPGSVDLAALLAGEQAILDSEVRRALELTALWAREIEELQAQAGLLHRQVALQDEIVAQVAASLAAAEDLQARGLQTTAQLSAAQLRDADARSRRLELDSALASISRAISDVRQQRARFLLDWRDGTLAAAAATAVAVGDALLRYERAEAQAAILNGGTAALSPGAGAGVRFRLVSPRPDRVGDIGGIVGLSTVLLPGDTLIVEVGPGLPAEGG